MRIIILPQAVRTILPPLTNQVVNLIKNTSTVAIISGADIMFTAKAWAYDTTNYVPAFAGAAFLYFIMCFPPVSYTHLTKLLVQLFCYCSKYLLVGSPYLVRYQKS